MSVHLPLAPRAAFPPEGVAPAGAPVALVSMPWMLANLPSIQLATLDAALRRDGLRAEVHELYLDFAAVIGTGLYEALAAGEGFIEEWLFARDYYAGEIGDSLDGFRAHRPRIGMPTPELDEQLLDELAAAAREFLDRVESEIDWRRHDIVGCSLTISQLGASMALARRLKRRHPHLRIVFGGTACAGPSGTAVLRACPYIDAVVRSEGEEVFPELVRRLRSGASLADLPGVSWRAAGGAVIANAVGPLFEQRSRLPPLEYDAYFQRLERLQLTDKLLVWVPFESSRGCWWGEKSQCTFCGLHEIMRSREWQWQEVYQQLQHLAERYRVSRFFAVDLILPEHYYQTFLPAVAQRNPGWSFFYEIKANVTRSDVEQLAAAGVRWIQPGIESLDTQVLDLMRKGCKPYQNVQLLKWCGQLGIRVSWNVIIGTPGEDPGLYTAMASLMSRLVHLPPPSGCIELALHRFSPYHMQPQEFGIENLGALGMYRHIFPLPQPLLDDLVYQFEFRVTGRAEPPRQYAAPAIAAAERWKRLHAAGASLRLQRHGDGTASIVDRRDPAGERVTALTADELALYDWLDPAAREETLEAGFERDHPAAWARLAPLAPRIERWDELGLVARTDGRTFALAMEAERPS